MGMVKRPMKAQSWKGVKSKAESSFRGQRVAFSHQLMKTGIAVR